MYDIDLQTGRKPSGLCGAALYVSALTHGLKFSKSDIVSKGHSLILLFDLMMAYKVNCYISFCFIFFS